MPTQPPLNDEQAPQINRAAAWLLLVLALTALPACAVGGWLLSAVPDPAQPLRVLVLQGLLPTDSPLLGAMAHATNLAGLLMLSCLPCAAIAAGMLKTQSWARIGFIVLMLVTAVLNLASVLLADWLIVQLIGPMMATYRALSDPAAFYPELWHVRAFVALFNLPIALIMAGLHLWPAWRFTRADMRRLYAR